MHYLHVLIVNSAVICTWIFGAIFLASMLVALWNLVWPLDDEVDLWWLEPRDEP